MMHLVIAPPVSASQEEIMYTVTSNTAVSQTTATVTNLRWLPDGPTTASVPLTAGRWVMMVYTDPAGKTQSNWHVFGVRTSTGDTMQQLRTGGGSQDLVTATEFTVGTDQSVTVLTKSDSSNYNYSLSPGDVIAFAPLP